VDLLEAIYPLVEEANEIFDRQILVELGEMPEERKNELAGLVTNARAVIRKTAAIGAFVISPETWAIVMRLEESLQKLRHEKDHVRLIEIRWEACGKAVADLRAEARRDLGLRPITFNRLKRAIAKGWVRQV
jgi:hypothetical protein